MGITTRWGIISTGRIAGDFAEALALSPDAELVAVGSRSTDSAETFGKLFSIPHRHATYEALADDPDVDVVYVATPHPFHMENSLLCLRAGKAVLCEKPFSINAIEAEAMIRTARAENLFLMEAMWTRYLPVMVKVRQLLADGAVGDVRLLQADFGFSTDLNPQGRLFDLQLGGGALLDVGVYTVSLASMVFGGPPTQITSMAHLGETGVDEQSALLLGYDQGQLAVLTCAVRTNTPHEAVILGSDGSIKINAPWWRSGSLVLSRPDQEDQLLETPIAGHHFQYEAAEVMECLRSSKTESETMPLDETIDIMKTLDTIRSQWGLKYPGE